jgi:hypothetical protein
MTYDEWLTFEGLCGHQHVCENDHGDPGALDIARLIGDDDMATPAEIWAYPLTIEGVTAPAGEWLGYLYAQVTRTEVEGGILMKNINKALADDK